MSTDPFTRPAGRASQARAVAAGVQATAAAPGEKQPPPVSPATEFRLRIFRGGYHPVPLEGKNPSVNGDGWQIKRQQTNENEIRLWERSYPYALNTGVLCRDTPVLDADILDPDAADDVEQFVKERFENHRVLTRIGLWPKRAFPFQTTTPFPKIYINLTSPDGTDTKGEKVEFLCDGQQCAVDGNHPDTREPYRWLGGTLGDMHHDDLPGITAEQARHLVHDIVELLVRDHGYQRKEKAKTSPQGDIRQGTGGLYDGNGPADWDRYLENLIAHDDDAGFVMALLHTNMSDAAVVNFMRAHIRRLANGDPARLQRRLNEVPSMVRTARAKIEVPVATPIKLTFFEELAKPAPKVWGIKGVFARGETSSWIGPPGGGKSGLVTDIAVHKAAGIDWRNYRTKGAEGVVYFALERADLVKRRVTAYGMRDGHKNLPIAVCSQVIDLMNKSCVAEIMDAIKQTEDRYGIAVALAIFDTYSKGIAAGGGNEGDAKDQNIAVANQRRVIDQTGIHIASVGHTGKDESRGERGSNAHKCDVDVEATFTGSKEIMTVEITKANDQDLGALTTFKLIPYDLGIDEDGEAFRTYIVTPEILDAAQVAGSRKLSHKQALAKRALAEVLASRGKPPPAEFGLPRSVVCVTDEGFWREEMYRNHTLDRSAKNSRARFIELRTALAARYVIGARDGLVWLPTPGAGT
jgi:hypothetical protein